MQQAEDLHNRAAKLEIQENSGNPESLEKIEIIGQTARADKSMQPGPDRRGRSIRLWSPAPYKDLRERL
jgi:hypothetical protein